MARTIIGVIPALRYQNRRRVPAATGTGFTTEPDGTYTVADIRVSVDLEKLVAAKGYRALRAKTGRSVLASGLIVIEAINRRTEP